jgi:hypothetical protein
MSYVQDNLLPVDRAPGSCATCADQNGSDGHTGTP